MATPGMNPDLMAIVQQLQASQGPPPGMPAGGPAPGATPPDPSGAYGAGGSPPMDPSMMGGDPYGGGDPNAPTPEEQAVWQEFPGTDPGAILAVLSQGPDGVAQAISMVEQDYDILSQHHERIKQIIAEHAATPGAPAEPPVATVPPGPGVGGQGLGL